ncbi:DUF4174 domain-containing protein [Indibacter alkaliphilus]|uniref:DUF4174 domain-containing protein n=1 Tax=Indibacter alkaliphilus TaxID=579922 RepID=UPI001F4845A5|nr:DUF4174 domain-containing protein [Indibacter alkaliphilus]
MLFIILQVQDKPKTLEDLRWKNRVVLYFPHDTSSWTFPDDSISNEIEERKIKYFVISDTAFSNSEMEFSQAYLDKLKIRYKMGSKLDSWVLIGLDGGAKVRKEEKIDWEYIFKTIDAMPMRQSEIRRGGG